MINFKGVNMFENRKAEKRFADISEAIPVKFQKKFTTIVKKFYDWKVTGNGNFKTYKVTAEELLTLAGHFNNEIKLSK